MQDWKTELEQKREAYRTEHNLPKIDNYGLAKLHHIKSKEIYDFISETDFANGDAFCFKKAETVITAKCSWISWMPIFKEQKQHAKSK